MNKAIILLITMVVVCFNFFISIFNCVEANINMKILKYCQNSMLSHTGTDPSATDLYQELTFTMHHKMTLVDLGKLCFLPVSGSPDRHTYMTY